MSQVTIQGYRARSQDATNYEGTNTELRVMRRRIKKTMRIIRARRCMRTRGRFYTKEYKKLREHMSDTTIIKRYNEIKDDLELELVWKHKPSFSKRKEK